MIDLSHVEDEKLKNMDHEDPGKILRNLDRSFGNLEATENRIYLNKAKRRHRE